MGFSLESFLFSNQNSVDEGIVLFPELGEKLGALCGILVLKKGRDDALEQVSDFGYELPYYYAFMARGMGFFEQVSESLHPLIVYASESQLAMEKSACAVCVKISNSTNAMSGFILLEFPENPSPASLFALRLYCDHLSENKKASPLPLVLKAESGMKRASEKPALISAVPGLEDRVRHLGQGRYFCILGPSGSGKKHIVKYILQKCDRMGSAVFVNLVPDSLPKIESMLEGWERMAGDSAIVLENADVWSISQQRFFYEYILEEKVGPLLVFLAKKVGAGEIYRPFWDLISSKAVPLPSLDNLEKKELSQVIRSVFRETSEALNKSDYSLHESAIDRLKFLDYPENIRTLKGRLEELILRSDSRDIDGDTMPRKFSGQIGEAGSEDLNLRRCIESLERQKIMLAASLFSGNQVRMAKALGISRGALQYKIRHLGIGNGRNTL